MNYFRWILTALAALVILFSTGCGTTSKKEGIEVRTDFQGRGVKVFQISTFPLYEATLEALKNMNLKVDDTVELEDAYQVTSKTKDLNIIIDIQEVGPKISRIRVRAEEGGFFSYSNNEDMATEIIKETALVLESKGQFFY
ncbi:MAG: hypothetical protein ACE5E9_00350 [Nitrospinaceae bacterium]